MKDDRLEKEFEEYFKGVKTPDNITESAKKYALKKPSAMPRIAKYASIAASIVLVCAVSLAVIFSTRISGENFSPAPGDDGNMANGGISGEDGGSVNNSDNAEDPGADDLSRTYSAADLVYVSENAYSLSTLNPALTLIEKFAYADNAQVSVCESGYLGEELAQVRAEITYVGTARDDTEIYVEFTDEDTIYEPLVDYLSGTVKIYNRCQYYLTQETAEDGELLFKLFIYYENVKYYVNVKSSDEQSYFKYLELIAG